MKKFSGRPTGSPSSTNFYNYKPGRILIGSLNCNDDLLQEITLLCRNNNICSGNITVIGAVQNARLGYYDQNKKTYTGCVSLDYKLEICSMNANISFKDNDIFVHAHIVLADHKGKTFGGHLMPGTKVFAAEFHINELIGKKLHRAKDPSTGLPLWSF